jgi:hypothetical protein
MAYFGGAFLLARVAAPRLIAHASLTQLPGTVHTLVLLFFGLTLATGALAGAVGAWQSGRAGQSSRLRRAANGVAGPMISIGALVATAYVGHFPLPSGPTKANAAIALTASVISGGLVAVLGRPAHPLLPPPTPDPPLTLHCVPLLLLAALVIHSQPVTTGTGGQVHDAVLANASPGVANDISPSECVVSEYENSGSATFTFLSFDLGPVFSYGTKTMADGSAEVEVAVGAKAGFTLSEGGHLLHLLGEGVSVSTDATLTETSTYTVAKEKEDQLVRWGVDRYAVSELTLPFFSGLLARTLDTSAQIGTAGYPTSSQVELAGSLELKANLGTGENYSTKLQLGAHAAIALENPHNRNRAFVRDPESVTLEIGLSGEGTGSAMTAFGGGVSADLTTDAAISLTLAKQSGPGMVGDLWIPSSVTADSTTGLKSSLDFKLASHDISKLAATGAGSEAARSKIHDASLGISNEGGVSLQITGSANLQQYPRLLADWLAVVAASGPASRSRPTPAELQTYQTTLRQLTRDLQQDGRLVLDLYDVATGSLDLEASAGEVITFGGAANLDTTTQTLDAAMIRPPGGVLGLSQTCVAAPH